MKTNLVLHQLIERAVENGWSIDYLDNLKIGEEELRHKRTNSLYYTLNDIIFDHSFAKALFGEEEIEWEVHCEPLDGQYDCYEPTHAPAWQYHLTQLALAPDRMKYLADYLLSIGEKV